MPNKLNIAPPPNNLEDLNHYSWRTWFMTMYSRIGSGPFGINGYSKSSLPSASDWGAITGETFSSLIFVYDEAGGPIICFSDGTNWRRLTDRAVVS